MPVRGYQGTGFQGSTEMKTRLLLSLVAVALAYTLTAEIARAGARHNEGRKEGGGRLRSAHHKVHERR